MLGVSSLPYKDVGPFHMACSGLAYHPYERRRGRRSPADRSRAVQTRIVVGWLNSSRSTISPWLLIDSIFARREAGLALMT